MFGHPPLKITKRSPSILLRVTARNAFSTHSVCINVRFTGECMYNIIILIAIYVVLALNKLMIGRKVQQTEPIYTIYL